MLEAVMLWNEPNNISHWDSELDPDWSRFARMVRWACEAVAAERPAITRVLGGISPIDPEFISTLYRQDLEPYLDVIAVHGFPLDWNLWQLNEWPDQIASIEAVANKPVWVTEVGASSFGSQEVQELGLRRTRELLAARVPRMYWYSLFDLPSASIAVTRHKESEGSAYYRHFYHGLLRENGTPKLALQSFTSAMGICQWIQFGDHQGLEDTVCWLRRLGVRHVRTGLSWADSHIDGAWKWFDTMMAALDRFEVLATLCFTPPSRGLQPHHTSPPIEPGEFAYFAQQVVRRYG
ncbi:MAG TPA: glycosyl hydrolase [Chloroflexota bacterium]|nr:glycosyl hydrolase [Chloroflexota bacterium]